MAAPPAARPAARQCCMAPLPPRCCRRSSAPVSRCSSTKRPRQAPPGPMYPGVAAWRPACRRALHHRRPPAYLRRSAKLDAPLCSPIAAAADPHVPVVHVLVWRAPPLSLPPGSATAHVTTSRSDPGCHRPPCPLRTARRAPALPPGRGVADCSIRLAMVLQLGLQQWMQVPCRVRSTAMNRTAGVWQVHALACDIKQDSNKQHSFQRTAH